MAGGWESVRLDEIEPIPVVDGTLLWRPVRRTLDIGAFGVNSYVAPNADDDVVEEHTETSLGHEELYLVLTGRATFTLDGDTLDAPAGTLVFLRDPAVKRHARAEAGTTVLAVGGPRGRAYEPSPWEFWFAAERHRLSGEYDAMVDEVAGASSATRITRRRSTTSAARRRSPDGPTTRSRTSGAPSSSSPSGPTTSAGTRTWRRPRPSRLAALTLVRRA